MNNSVASIDQTGIDLDLLGIAALCDGKVQHMIEGERRYIHMERLHFFVRGVETCMDALLCLNYPNEAYPTKLYFPTNLGLGLNWNETSYILAKTWFTWSWRGVVPGQPPLAILAGHLEAFK